MRPTSRVFFSVAALVCFSSCKTRFKASSLRTTSDRLQESILTVRGTIELPTDREVYVTNHLMNLVGWHVEAPATATKPASYNSYQALNQQFADDPKAGHPVIDGNGKLDVTALRYWIAAQAKYSKRVLAGRGIALTLDQVLDEGLVVERPRPDTVKISFRAIYRAVGQVNAHVNPSQIANQQMLETGEKVQVPLDPVRFFHNEFSEYLQRGWDTFGFNLASLDPAAYDGVMGDMGALSQRWLFNTQGRTETVKCYTFGDGSVLNPFYLFYYFDARNQGCSSPGVVDLVVEKAESKKMDSGKFPEYHRLFAGEGPLDIFYFFGIYEKSSVEAEFYKEILPRMKALGFTISGQPDLSGLVVFTKSIQTHGGRSVPIRLTIASEHHNDRAREAFRSAIGSADVVYFGGHAGAGANIEGALKEPSSYPKGKYQIIALDGCQTYVYGMAEVLAAKALADFDNQAMNIDLISSFDYVSGWRQKDVILESLIRAAVLSDAPESAWTQADRDELSWLGWVKAIHAAMTADGGSGSYMVSGEENNEFSPGATIATSKGAAFGSGGDEMRRRLQSFLGDSRTSDDLKLKALSSLVALRYSEFKTVEEFIEYARNECLAMGSLKLEGDRENLLFYFPSCQLRILPFDKSQVVSYRGNRYSGLAGGGSALEFWPNGMIKTGSPQYDISFGTFRFQFGKKTEWHENGALKSSPLGADVSLRGRTCSTGQVIVFDRDRNPESCVFEGKIDLGMPLGMRRISSEINFMDVNSEGTLSAGIWLDEPVVGLVLPGGQPFSIKMGSFAWVKTTRVGEIAVTVLTTSDLDNYAVLSSGEVFVVKNGLEVWGARVSRLELTLEQSAVYLGRQYQAGDIITIAGL